MNTKQFLVVAKKLAETGLIRVARANERNANLGFASIGSIDSQNVKLWRTYGTLENIIIFKTKEEVNEILKAHGIHEFKAKSTKSGDMSRLVEVKY